MSRPTRVLSSDNINIFTILALAFVPVDAFPLVFSTTYRPVSLLLILPVFILILLNSVYKRKIDGLVLAGILALIGLSVISLLVTREAGLELGGFSDYFVTFTIGIATFAVFRYTFIKVRDLTASNDDYTRLIFKYLVIGAMLMVVVGCMELIALYTPVLPAELKSVVNLMMSGKTTSRLQLMAGEPSWAARQALFGLPILLISKGRRSLWTLLLFLMILLTFSLEGLALMALSFSIYITYIYWDRKLVLAYNALKIATLVAAVMTVVFVLGKSVFLEKNEYFYSRFSRFSEIKLSEITFSNAIYLDESVFIRVASPMIGIFMFLDNPILGAGGGNFRYYYGHYIREKFPRAMTLPYFMVAKQIRGKQDQGKNLYTRVLGEFGLAGALIFIFFLSHMIGALKRAHFANPGIKRYLYLWLIICLVSLLQFDSLAYFNFWLLAAFFFTLSPHDPNISRETRA